MFKSLTSKIIAGVIVLAIACSLVYFLIPQKEKEVIVEVEKEVEVYVPYDKIIEVEKEVIVEVEKEVILEVPTATEETISLRTDKVEGFIDTLEKKIERWDKKIEDIDLDIEKVQDKINDKTEANVLLQAYVDSKQGIINALVAEDATGNISEIRALEDEIIVFEDDMEANQNKIENWLEAIEDLENDKEPWQERIDLENKCISEIDFYITSGSEFSDDVQERLEILGLL